MCKLTQVCFYKIQLQKEKYHKATNSISRFFRASVEVHGVSVTCTKNFKMLDYFDQVSYKQIQSCQKRP